jgi:hypothetical protein
LYINKPTNRQKHHSRQCPNSFSAHLILFDNAKISILLKKIKKTSKVFSVKKINYNFTLCLDNIKAKKEKWQLPIH